MCNLIVTGVKTRAESQVLYKIPVFIATPVLYRGRNRKSYVSSSSRTVGFCTTTLLTHQPLKESHSSSLHWSFSWKLSIRVGAWWTSQASYRFWNAFNSRGCKPMEAKCLLWYFGPHYAPIRGSLTWNWVRNLHVCLCVCVWNKRLA
jgi:hypothetical protein